MNETLPLVSIVIPTFNRKETLSREIQSIMQSEYGKEKIEIVIVDDAGTDQTAEYIARNFPSIRILRNESERGPAASRNLGIKSAKGDFIFILDDDNIVDRECISRLVDAITEDDSIGIAAPAMYYLKEPNRVWCMGLKRSYITSLTKFHYRDFIADSAHYPSRIDSYDFPNAFMINKKVIEKIGLFDEATFPIHYEEADFGERVRRANFKVVCLTAAKVWHDISLPEETDKARLLHCHNEYRAFYSGRNRIIFHRRYSKRWQFLIFVVFCNWFISLYYIAAILRSEYSVASKLKITKSFLNGIWHGLRDH